MHLPLRVLAKPRLKDRGVASKVGAAPKNKKLGRELGESCKTPALAHCTKLPAERAGYVVNLTSTTGRPYEMRLYFKCFETLQSSALYPFEAQLVWLIDHPQTWCYLN